MAETELVNEAGVSVFRGTQRPPGGGSQTLAQVLVEGDDADGGNITNVQTLDAAVLVALGFLVVGNDSIAVIPVINAPNAGSGLGAALGSVALRTNGQAWLKTGAGDTDWTQFGLADPGIKIVRVPIAFDDPDILTGITLYTPTAGDALLLDQCYMSIPTPFNGTNTAINLTYSNLAGAFGSNSIVGLQDILSFDGHTLVPIISLSGSSVLFGASGPVVFPDATPLKLVVDDGAGGNPGMTAGAGVVVLAVIPA